MLKQEMCPELKRLHTGTNPTFVEAIQTGAVKKVTDPTGRNKKCL